MSAKPETPAPKLSKDIRLISPMHARIYPNPLTGHFQSPVGSVFHHQRRGLKRGEADAITAQALMKMGWRLYSGPAVTDDRGWIVPGSDPNLRNGGAGNVSTR